MQLLAECTGCHHVAPVPADWAGTEVRCPKCSQDLYLEADEDDDRPELCAAECPSCGQQTWVSEELIGMHVLCPRCHGVNLLELDDDEPEIVVAQCMDCGHKSNVPHDWIGTLVQCPKCHNQIILEPATADRSQKSTLANSGALTRPAVPVRKSTRPVEHVSPRYAPRPVEQPPKAKSWLDPVSPFGLLLSVAAIVCASYATTCAWVRPLCVGGLAAGVAALVVSQVLRCRPALPAAGIAVSAVVVLVVALFPGLLGETYGAYRDRSPLDPTIRVVPLAGRPTPADPNTPDWVDASRAALAQGPLRIEVVGATIAAVVTRNASGELAHSKDKYLIVRLRIRRTKARFADMPADAAKSTLTDPAGKVLAQPDVIIEAGAYNAAGWRGPVFPLGETDHVLVFAPPPAEVPFVRLEVDAATWGGVGAFRFTIPKSMIWTEQPTGPVNRG